MTSREPAWNALLDAHASDDDLVAIVDSEFILRAASPALGLALDLEPTHVIGTSTAELMHPEDILRALEVFEGRPSSGDLRPPNIYRIRTGADGVYRAFGVTSESVLDGMATVLRLYEPTSRTPNELRSLEQIDVFEMMSNGRSLDDCLLALVVMVERNSEGTRAIIHISDDDGALQPVSSGSLPRTIRDRFVGAPIDDPGPGLSRALRTDRTHVEPSSLPGFTSGSVTVARRPDGRIAGYLELLHAEVSTNQVGSTEAAMPRLVCRLIGLIEAALSEPTVLDELTGLPNRRALKTLAGGIDDNRPYGVLIVDVDVAESGHEQQSDDALLAGLGKLMRGLLPIGATAFRSGSHEFVLIIPGESSPDALRFLGKRLLAAIADEPSMSVESGVRPSVSIGATTSAGQVEPFAELLGQADTAMRVAKRDGGDRVRLHEQPLDDRWVHRRALGAALPAAIEAGELVLEFQPIISLVSHYITGFEAFARWHHPRFGTLSPGDFLPIAEETSLIHAVDTWVLDTAAREVSAWNRASRRPLEVWVNLSARSLARQDLVNQILELQNRHEIQLGIELTERDSFASSLHADAACERLKAAGIKIALDDFGSGRSGLYRAVFHGPSVLKIDHAFVNGMLASEADMAKVATIIELGQQLDLAVIAEGVESEPQMRRLELMGCERAQGYLFAPPLSAATIHERLGPDFDDLRVVRLSAPNQAGDNLDV